MYFDTHAHYDDAAFDADRDALLSALPESGVDLVMDPGCDVESSRAAVALAEKHSHVYAAVGLHPENCGNCSRAELAVIRELAAHPKAVAIGEIGLDYHWDTNPPKAFQQEIFRLQLELAGELDLPVIVHDRDAHGDSLAIVEEFPKIRGVFHCYSGSAEMAEILLKRGWYLGFDGPVTYKNARKAREVAEATPPDRILLETDSPYLSPVPNRGKRNDSRNLSYIVKTLSMWKNMDPAELAQVAKENGKRLFGIEV
ncbi:putative deoxyribonuclease [Oscillibacter valericigenes Sjm18-20]|nr:putative deoxyribonuclease [Oscillibacter valericigenes Sjm18-20]